MEQVQGYKLSGFPFENLSKVKDLLYYDGPLLSHFTDESDMSHYFSFWVDYDEVYNRWLVFKVNEGDLIDYLQGIIPLYDLIWKDTNDFLYLVDIDADVNYHNTTLIRHFDLPDSYIPDEDSYFYSPVPEVYKSLLDTYQTRDIPHADYINALREHAMFLKITPNSKKHGTVVSTYDASDFLKEISNSYLGFAEAVFAKEFSQAFLNYEKFQTVKKQVIAQVEPRLVQVGISSFAVGIAPDYLSDHRNESISAWKKSVINDFKEQIINIDYSSDEELEKVKSKFSEEERQAIFKPLIKVLKNKKYTISITDYRFKDKRKLKVLPKKAETALITKDSVEAEKQEAVFELVSIIVEKPINESVEKLSKKSLQEGLLFSQPTDGFKLVLDSITYKDDEIHLKKPLDVDVRYNNKVYTISIPELKININTSNKEELMPLINKELYNRVVYLTTITNLTEEDLLQSQFLNNYLIS